MCRWLKQKFLFCIVPLLFAMSPPHNPPFFSFQIPAHWNSSVLWQEYPILAVETQTGLWQNALLVAEEAKEIRLLKLWTVSGHCSLVSVPLQFFSVDGSAECNEPSCHITQSRNVRTGRDQRLFHFCGLSVWILAAWKATPLPKACSANRFPCHLPFDFLDCFTL